MSILSQPWVVFLLIGLVAGFLASLVVGGGGLLSCLLSGVIGAFVGGFLFHALGISLGIQNLLVVQIIHATVGAIIVVLLARAIA
ncbi:MULTISPECIES: GlsB/YeaQ/YmgE family stress response membrane protein [Rhizobium]|uniref:GlsB/YeaQ/YmgE family stress response membrane protein n=1 Tax=Rhizobium rhododendri TaxID=2506430 RepID=A0ABY8IM35_9HYPH|nr:MULTISPECIES: GlsB/YeaQ/YmgE family stress response membrane protein [Rhizobium]MBO9098322.1 GlsB/YeaQ/YmgE family stress response membrane protein [Rhizobium sp. L58/93]MBO9132874.1 GlsB/YeaQ/YmgE family stress response membrane protein [Rhizobium sp. B209b/85]MBO9168588.1 GlsB/YeaQ/YmgE family stress response membrane protein [Rhizobium sp. L245/93]MBO9184517.1 GlsB/YeaQ/YmgE family stress response membrane protein [Rhizobium sp. E27B/91]MBZ5761499.1 GlsB/YeaQ/YmgE family stress response 